MLVQILKHGASLGFSKALHLLQGLFKAATCQQQAHARKLPAVAAVVHEMQAAAAAGAVPALAYVMADPDSSKKDCKAAAGLLAALTTASEALQQQVALGAIKPAVQLLMSDSAAAAEKQGALEAISTMQQHPVLHSMLLQQGLPASLCQCLAHLEPWPVRAGGFHHAGQ